MKDTRDTQDTKAQIFQVSCSVLGEVSDEGDSSIFRIKVIS